MVFLSHILSGVEHVLSSGYGRYFIVIPFVFAVVYLVLYVLVWGGSRN